jgi:electron transfer flavoprotein alpha subunit
MTTILFIGHSEPDGCLSRHSLEALAAARSLLDASPGAQLVAAVTGADAANAAAQLSGSGAARVILVSDPALGQARYATDIAAAEAVCKEAHPAFVIVPATSRWNRVIAGLAHRANGVVDTHVSGLSASNGVPTVTRWYYRQRMEGVFTRTQRPWFLAIDSGVFAPWHGHAGDVSIETVDWDASCCVCRTQVQGTQAPPADQQTIRPDAELLFVAGAGWTKKQPDGQVKLKEAEGLILSFLKASRASLGSSKSLVDLGGEGQQVLPFLSHLNQIGQTGSTPRHPKGLSTCCHGEEPHTVGWRFVHERRVISLDPNCGWSRGKADVLYVADAFAVMGAVNRLLT